MGNSLAGQDGSKSLSKEDVNFLVENTDLNEGVIYTMFDKFLVGNKSGKIAKQDFREVMQACLPRTYKVRQAL